jgi:hypothetical protein
LRIFLVLGVLLLVLELKHRAAEDEADDEEDVQACEYVIEFMGQSAK